MGTFSFNPPALGGEKRGVLTQKVGEEGFNKNREPGWDGLPKGLWVDLEPSLFSFLTGPGTESKADAMGHLPHFPGFLARGLLGTGSASDESSGKHASSRIRQTNETKSQATNQYILPTFLPSAPNVLHVDAQSPKQVKGRRAKQRAFE